MAEVNSPLIQPTSSTRIGSIIALMLCTIPMVSALVYGAVDSLALGVLFAVMALIAILWFADAWQKARFEYSAHHLQLPLFGLILIAIIQLLPLGDNSAATALLNVPAVSSLSLDPYATRFFLIQLVAYLIFFAAALTYINGASRVKKIGVAIIVFGTLIAFFGILQRLSMPEAIYGLRPTPQAIPFGPYVNQHHFAALMQMTSGIALGLLFGGRISREQKLMVGLAAGVMGMAIVFTGSRGGLIGYFCVISFVTLASLGGVSGSHRAETEHDEPKNRNVLIVAAAIGLMVLVLGSVLMLGGQDSLLRAIGLEYGESDVTSGRLHFWRGAWKIFLEHPLIGAGFDAFSLAFSRFDTWNGFYKVERAHNDYLQILADAGILGFACVVAFVLIFVKKGITAIGAHGDRIVRSIVIGSFAGCMGILVHSLFDFPLRTPANGFFFLLLVVLVVGSDPVARQHRSR